MTSVDRMSWSDDDLLSPEPDVTTAELDLTALDGGPTPALGLPPAPGDDQSLTVDDPSPATGVDPTSSPLATATSAVSTWVQDEPRFDPTEAPSELRTVATDRDHTVTAAMSRRRLVALEVHPEVWMSDPADVTDAIIDAVNATLAEHEVELRAELESAGSGIGEATKAASELHASVAEALGRELDDVIASVARTGATVQPTEARS